MSDQAAFVETETFSDTTYFVILATTSDRRLERIDQWPDKRNLRTNNGRFDS